jgi:hypothetical protein
MASRWAAVRIVQLKAAGQGSVPVARGRGADDQLGRGELRDGGRALLADFGQQVRLPRQQAPLKSLFSIAVQRN